MFEEIIQKYQSSAYEMVLDMGQERTLHKTLLKLGKKKFGPASVEVEAAINALTELDRMDRMLDTLDYVSDWQAWLQT